MGAADVAQNYVVHGLLFKGSKVMRFFHEAEKIRMLKRGRQAWAQDCRELTKGPGCLWFSCIKEHTDRAFKIRVWDQNPGCPWQLLFRSVWPEKPSDVKRKDAVASGREWRGLWLHLEPCRVLFGKVSLISRQGHIFASTFACSAE